MYAEISATDSGTWHIRSIAACSGCDAGLRVGPGHDQGDQVEVGLLVGSAAARP